MDGEGVRICIEEEEEMEGEEEIVKKELEEAQKKLEKKRSFEQAVCSIRSLLQRHYRPASPFLKTTFFRVVSRVAAVLKSRYTSSGFWAAGLGLFRLFEPLLSIPSERDHIARCVALALENLETAQNEDAQSSIPSASTSGYLFEGHLTVDPEPPRPNWLVQSELLASAAATLLSSEASQDHLVGDNMSQSLETLIQQMADNLEAFIPEGGNGNGGGRRAPPASKEVVARLPVVTMTKEAKEAAGVGKGEAECAICKDRFEVGDQMQHLPCSHTFHPLCLSPWLEERNSCPMCRHELMTDDHNYESWKEREKEAEEERKGAANALRGGEFMYV